MTEPVPEQSIFLHALELPSPAERAAYLDQVCRDNPGLRAELDALLAAHDRLAGQSPATSGLDLAGNPRAESTGAFPGARTAVVGEVLAGRYKLVEPIGEGGMGTVWMAQQTEPVRRRVAIKLIKPGMDSKQVLARFDAERQALALMDHPNIAKVHDAGTAPDGRPYFVMELVKGVTITRFCDEHRLTPRRRLELFVPVCHAIQHAHHKGIIHRDLKPSNVLVALYDDRPVPKVIDFGVAKATGPQLTEQTLNTDFGSVVGTIEYMSPEQASFNQLDVDTRSDIYSLGVLLYELLTGSPPFGRKELEKSGMLEMLRIIREQEPSKPSTKLSMAEGLPTLAANRGTEPARLTRLMRGDLDWIVMKSLEKGRGRRYDTASAMAADVEHYLRDEPVSAGPPGAGYRLRKFVRRNRGLVVAASLVLLALVCGVIGTTFGLIRAERAADAERAAKVTAQQRLKQVEKGNQILGSIFKDLNPNTAEVEGKPLQVLLGERLDQATGQLEGEVIGDPLAVARMQVILGHSQGGLGHAKKAVLLFSKARATFTAQLGADDRETLESMHYQAMGYHDLMRLDLAVPLFKETFERRKAALGPDDPDTLRSMNDLALGYRDDGKLDLALPLLEEAVKLAKAKHGLDDPDTLVIMNSLGLVYLQDAGKVEQAVPLFEETLKRRRVDLPPGHLDIIQSMNNLALAYRAADKLDQAVRLFVETLQRVKEKLGVDHPYTLKTMSNLALTYQDAGKIDLALPLYAEALQRTKAKFPADHPDTLRCMGNLAWGYQAAGKLDLAVPLYEETLLLAKVKFGPDNPRTLEIINRLGRGYIQSDQPARAEPLLREYLALRAKHEPEGWKTFDAKSLLGAALRGEQMYAEAEPLLLAGYEGMRQRQARIPGSYKIRLIEDLQQLVKLYEAVGNHDKVIEWRKKLAEALAAAKAAAQ